MFADKGYDAKANRALCRRFGAKSHIHKRGQLHGSGLGRKRCPAERTNTWLLENKRLTLRYDSLRLHRAGPAPGHMHTYGCTAPRSGIVKTAS